MKERKIRATIKTNGVAIHRHNIYTNVMSKVSEAIKEGFYLEAITLLESIIADRLESLCNQESQSNNNAFECLGRLIKRAKQYQISDTWADVLNELEEWKEKRNDALHQMAKIEDGDFTSFEERYILCKSYAMNGKRLFRNIDNEIRKYRRVRKSK